VHYDDIFVRQPLLIKKYREPRQQQLRRETRSSYSIIRSNEQQNQAEKPIKETAAKDG
jgi:hypothetical protein